GTKPTPPGPRWRPIARRAKPSTRSQARAQRPSSIRRAKGWRAAWRRSTPTRPAASLRNNSVCPMSQIVVEGVTHTYRPPRGRPVLALDGVSLDVATREFLALLGPSGCGKSTLLYLIGGFLPTETGKIMVDGKPVSGPGPDRGIVFQHFALFPWKTVRANILYGLE